MYSFLKVIHIKCIIQKMCTFLKVLNIYKIQKMCSFRPVELECCSLKNQPSQNMFCPRRLAFCQQGKEMNEKLKIKGFGLKCHVDFIFKFRILLA